MTKSQYRKLARNAKYVWGVGAVIVAVGEYLGAFGDDAPGGTISEWFWAQGPVVQFFVIFTLGVVFCHLIAWGRKNETTINVENVTVEAEGAA